MKILITDMQQADWPAVKTIYEQGIAGRNATFETTIPDWLEWNKKYLSSCRLIAKNEDNILGWAALSQVSQRSVYRGVAEVSLYVHQNSRAKGVGNLLLEKLIVCSEKNGIWTLQAGIFPENDISIQLHLKYGFRKVGYREKLGKLDNAWRDVVLLERRSKITGTA